MNTDEKIKSREELKGIFEILRTKGKKIGFTCGAFDLLHSGHVQYLEEAKSTCDILVVAVNTDESVHTYKGEKRPIIPEKERKKMFFRSRGIERSDLAFPVDPVSAGADAGDAIQVAVGVELHVPDIHGGQFGELFRLLSGAQLVDCGSGENRSVDVVVFIDRQ